MSQEVTGPGTFLEVIWTWPLPTWVRVCTSLLWPLPWQHREAASGAWETSGVLEGSQCRHPHGSGPLKRAGRGQGRAGHSCQHLSRPRLLHAGPKAGVATQSVSPGAGVWCCHPQVTRRSRAGDMASENSPLQAPPCPVP